MAVVFVFGLPGSGKLTYIKNFFPDFKLINISDFQKALPFGCSNEERMRQMLAEYDECKNALVEAVKTNENVVLKHTLLRAMRRTPYIEAVRNVTDQPIIAYVFNPGTEAILKMRGKEDSENTREQIEQEKSILEMPTESEGFDEIHIITEAELPDLSEHTYSGKGSRWHVRKDHAKTIYIPADVNSIDDSFFYGWIKVENFVVDKDNKHYTDIDGVLFDSAKTILCKYPEGRRDSTYNIPDGVTTIKHGAFSDYRDFIERNAYEVDCGEFEITIPASVSTIEGIAFGSCTRRLVAIHVDERNQHFASIDGILYDKNIETLICCPAGNRSKEIIIPDTVKEICGDAFCGCINLERITFPDNLIIIGGHAFEECRNLIEIRIPGKVREICSFTFAYCYKLTNVILEEGVPFIDEGAFAMCNFLKNILLPRSLSKIEPDLFSSASLFSSAPSLKIHCYEGSYAHSFAKDKNIPFTLIGDTLPDFASDTDAIRGNLRIEGSSLEEKLMGDPEIADILGKILNKHFRQQSL